MFLVKKENNELTDKPKVFSRKATDHFQVWHKTVKTYFRYEKKKFAVIVNQIAWLGGRLDWNRLF
jgi:hypothetical protein